MGDKREFCEAYGRKSLKLEDGGEQRHRKAEEEETKVFEGSRACSNILLPLWV